MFISKLALFESMSAQIIYAVLINKQAKRSPSKIKPGALAVVEF